MLLARTMDPTHQRAADSSDSFLPACPDPVLTTSCGVFSFPQLWRTPRMRSALARFSPSRVPPDVERALLGVAWVAGWAGLCAWVVWIAHSQAANPRQEAMRAWCRTRVRYLHQDILSCIARAQESIGLVGAFGHFGPRSSSNLSYWGLAGCVNNASLLDYNLRADAIANYSTGTVIMFVSDRDRSPPVDAIANYSTDAVIVFVSDRDRPLVENITGFQIRSVLGLPAPRKDLYGVNVYGSINPDFPLQPFTDFSPVVPPAQLDNLLKGKAYAGAPCSAGPGYVASVFVIPIFSHSVPANASLQEIRSSVRIAWGGVVHLEWRARELLRMLENGSTTYSFAMYDNTEAGELKQIYGPDEPRLERASAFPAVLPTPVLVPPDHVEPFPEDMLGRTYEAHCRFLREGAPTTYLGPRVRSHAAGPAGAANVSLHEVCLLHMNANPTCRFEGAYPKWDLVFEGAYPKWDLVYAPMLLGLLVLLVAVLLSIMIAVLAWKRRNIEADVKEIQICTAILERAERSKSEAVASTSHELRTPIIGMMGMIEELLDSPLEEWQYEDLRVARACAGETVELINRVLDLAKLQAGRLQLETLPCCLRRIVREATAVAEPIAPGKNLQVHVDESVPETLLGDPTRLLQVTAELVDTGGGIPPEELWGLLDPHGLACHSPHDMHGNGHHKVMGGKKVLPGFFPDPFLQSRSFSPQVAEMRGGMAVLSDASTGTTILLALPLGGGELAGSSRGTGEENENRVEFGKSEGAGEEPVKRESGSRGDTDGSAGGAVAMPHAAAATAQPALPPLQSPAVGVRALVRAHTCPQVEMEKGMRGGEGVGEAERVVRGAVAGRGVAVVDDNAVNRMVARRTLQGYGAHVLLLCSGEDALQALSSAPKAPQQALSSATPSPPIHLLLLDLHMPPGIDGFETARRLRAMEDAQKMNEADQSVGDAGSVTCASRQRICIIALTADLDAGIKRACLEAGMDGAVRKPITAQELAAVFSAIGLS
ncbi:unnamed protein product [Closterium sp. Yama58-4]|nr:unnamed protein product [Closterium sp. Yama58-4]